MTPQSVLFLSPGVILHFSVCSPFQETGFTLLCNLDSAPKEILEQFNGLLVILKAEATEAEQDTVVQACRSGNGAV